MAKGFRFRVVLILACLMVHCAASYEACAILYDRVMKRSEAWHLKVEEVPSTHPLQLRITMDADQGFMVIRSVTTRTRGRELNVQYHLALSGLAEPRQYWGKAYTLTVPDSVVTVSFGPTLETIWKRTNSGE